VNVGLLLIVIATLLVTIYSVYKAFTNGENWWGVGILIAWFVGLGWVVGLVYIFVVDRRRAPSI
jgi:hypothetical protein